VLNIIKLVDELERKAFDLTTKDEVEEMEKRLQMLVDLHNGMFGPLRRATAVRISSQTHAR